MKLCVRIKEIARYAIIRQRALELFHSIEQQDIIDDIEFIDHLTTRVKLIHIKSKNKIDMRFMGSEILKKTTVWTACMLN